LTTAITTTLRVTEPLTILLTSPVTIAQGEILVNGKSAIAFGQTKSETFTLTDTLQPGLIANTIGLSAMDIYSRAFESKALLNATVISNPPPPSDAHWRVAALLALATVLASMVAALWFLYRWWVGNRKVCTLEVENTGNIAAAYALWLSGHGNEFRLKCTSEHGLKCESHPDRVHCTSSEVKAGDTMAISIEVVPYTLHFRTKWDLTVRSAPVRGRDAQPVTTDDQTHTFKDVDMSSLVQRARQTAPWIIASLALAVVAVVVLILSLGQFAT
jgi:hypothetical protein